MCTLEWARQLHAPKKRKREGKSQPPTMSVGDSFLFFRNPPLVVNTILECSFIYQTIYSLFNSSVIFDKFPNCHNPWISRNVTTESRDIWLSISITNGWQYPPSCPTNWLTWTYIYMRSDGTKAVGADKVNMLYFRYMQLPVNYPHDPINRHSPQYIVCMQC